MICLLCVRWFSGVSRRARYAERADQIRTSPHFFRSSQSATPIRHPILIGQLRQAHVRVFETRSDVAQP